ncbi:uncharacterized protein [Dysidea avara]|uniref:uncharacterized protein n=1 Tax=Dysidea avara TaxID=196820 RepID=UPI00331AE70E
MYVKHRISTGNVEVDYIFTHTNHSPGLEEVKHIPIPTSVQEEIQQKFSQGVSVEKIMKDIQEDIGSRHLRQDFDEVVARKHLIKRQDCRNAIRKTRDFTNHRHTNDAISVDRIVKELQLESPSSIIAYKPQGIVKADYPSLQESSFFLALMTSFQADMFKEFSTLGCVDSKHKTTQYGYKLITLVVADEFRNGIPVAWGITDVEDTNRYTVFFSAIRKRVPDAVIDILMTDDDPSMIGGCVAVYPDVIHLLCRWHVDSAWKNNLRHLVANDVHKVDMYKYLCTLITTPDPSTFQTHIKAFTTLWQKKEPRFIEYFNGQYANRIEKWALAYRHFDHKDTDTNMFVESFFNKLKTNPKYFNHKVNRRCDDLIEVLLMMETDVFFERKRKELLSSTGDASKKQEGDRHNRGISVDVSRVHSDDENSSQYHIDSSDLTMQYKVYVLLTVCPSQPNCMPHCSEEGCGYLCRHMIRCTCYDY